MNEAPDRTIILGLQHWVTRPDLETIFETKMVSKWSRDHFETRMSHYLEWRDWFRDHIRDQNSLNSGLETSIDTKMSHSGLQIILDHRSLSSIGQKILMILQFQWDTLYVFIYKGILKGLPGSRNSCYAMKSFKLLHSNCFCRLIRLIRLD